MGNPVLGKLSSQHSSDRFPAMSPIHSRDPPQIISENKNVITNPGLEGV